LAANSITPLAGAVYGTSTTALAGGASLRQTETETVRYDPGAQSSPGNAGEGERGVGGGCLRMDIMENGSLQSAVRQGHIPVLAALAVNVEPASVRNQCRESGAGRLPTDGVASLPERERDSSRLKGPRLKEPPNTAC
jgi:hypothetical protein